MKKTKLILILLLLLSIITTVGNTYTVINNWGNYLHLFTLIICSLCILMVWSGYVLVIVVSLNMVYIEGKLDEIKELQRLGLL
jgi:hypothetical protein